MKFFWKVFFCTMFISVIFFSLGGFILINTTFNSLIKSEVESTYDMSDIIFYTLSTELEDKANLLIYEYGIVDEQEFMRKTAHGINIYQSNKKLLFSILDTEGEIVFSTISPNFSKGVIQNLGTGRRGYFIREKEDKYYVQTLTPVTLLNKNFYIETQQDVTKVFNNEKNQFRLLLIITYVMLVVAGLITYFITRILFRRINALTKTIKAIDSGNLKKRVRVNGNDEFTVLSRSFNRMADDLQFQMIELEEEAKNRERFVAAFSHELKTPLTSIIGYSDMLRSKIIPPERVQSHANYIFTEGKRLENLSMRLLELFVMKNETLNLKAVYMPEFFEEIYSAVSPQFKSLEINFQINIQPAMVSMEPDLMKTVFLNILDNARKSIDKNGKIYIEGFQIRDNYMIQIDDNGCGMNDEDLSKIKEAFYMVDKSRARKQGGAGLGLSICEEILNLHDFEIFFESELGEGTTVVVKMKGVYDYEEFEK